jgi:GalNAc5-diNAcBac-PP-undecaprenol beta-1,3-glucosyltransferase
LLKIGIVIPTYKREKLLQRAIESIISQGYTNYAICVVDDNSPDNTESLMSTYINTKIHYIKLDQNFGVNIARNTAINYLLSDEINCDYITMLDDDDYFLANTFAELDKQITSHHCHWLIFNRIYPNGERITKHSHNSSYQSYFREHYCQNSMTGDMVMFISKQLMLNKRFEESFRAREYLFFFLLNQESPMYVTNFDAVVCEYLPDGMTFSQPRDLKAKRKTIRKTEQKILKSVGLSYEYIEYERNKTLMKKCFQEKNYTKIFKYLRHTLKWKVRMYFGI